MIIDLESKESYTNFLNQIKDLGMTKTRFCYMLATLVIQDNHLLFFTMKKLNLKKLREFMN